MREVENICCVIWYTATLQESKPGKNMHLIINSNTVISPILGFTSYISICKSYETYHQTNS